MLNALTKLHAILLVVLILSKVVFLSILSHHFDPSLSGDRFALLWGIRFDLAALAFVSVPVVLSYFLIANKVWVKWVTAVICAWIIFATFSDTVYLTQANRHLTFEIFMVEGSVYGLLATLITQYWVYFLISVLMLLAVCWGLYSLKLAPTQGAWKTKVTLFILWLCLGISAVRGGWTDVPQSPMSAFDIGRYQQAVIAWSAPYAISYYLTKGAKKAAFKLAPDASPQDDEYLLSKALPESQIPTQFIAPKKKANVLVVLLESWGSIDTSDQITPHFNALRKQSFSTAGFYANGYRTVEGIFSTFCSYPNPIGGGVAGTQLQSLSYHCLPQILLEQGWQTSFIQGSYRGIVGSFAQHLGFEYSYGKEEYNFEGIHNYWGYMDDDIYRFTLDKLAKTTEPFLMVVNTGTTHDTYLPQDDDYVFGKQNEEGIRRSVIHHADAALGRFIERLPKVLTTPTLVIFVADHTLGVGKLELEKNAIPFVMFANDGSITNEEKPYFAGQMDIAPTIIDWLGGYVPWFTGDSLLDDEYQGYASYSYGKTLAWIKGNQLTLMDIVNPEQSAHCYYILTPLLVDPTSCHFDQLNQAGAFTRYTQEMLFKGDTQRYINRTAKKEESLK